MNKPAASTDAANTASPELDLLRRATALVFVTDLASPQLEGDDAHHLSHVLRLKNGECVVAADGKGSFVACRYQHEGPAKAPGRTKGAEAASSVQLVIDGPVSTFVSTPPVTVAFSLVKGDRNDWAIQKLTELGVDRIQPLLTERSVLRLDGPDRQRRGERFRRIAKEAASQSRRPALPVIEDPIDFAQAVMAFPNAAIAEPGGGEFAPGITTVFVGPEGGWSDQELASGLAPVDLGPTVLRAETAAIVAACRMVALRSAHPDA